MYRLFIWSTAYPSNTAQGIMDFHSKESAVSTYRFILDIAMQGRDKITCLELYTVDGNDESDELLYSATFPE